MLPLSVRHDRPLLFISASRIFLRPILRYNSSKLLHSYSSLLLLLFSVCLCFDFVCLLLCLLCFFNSVCSLTCFFFSFVLHRRPCLDRSLTLSGAHTHRLASSSFITDGPTDLKHLLACQAAAAATKRSLSIRKFRRASFGVVSGSWWAREL